MPHNVAFLHKGIEKPGINPMGGKKKARPLRSRSKTTRQCQRRVEGGWLADIARSMSSVQPLAGTCEGIMHAIRAWCTRHGLLGKPADEFGLDLSMIEILRPFFQFLYYIYFRVEARGAQHVPAKGPAILVANHSGAFPYDGVMTHLAVYNEHPKGRIVRYLVDDYVFEVPLLRSFIMRAGGVRACHENATRLLDRGELIVVFPEGVKGVSKTFDQRYRLLRFGRGGFIRLAMRTGVPIVPVAVIGAEEIHPIIWKSRRLARPLGLPFIPFTPTFPWLGPLGFVPLPSKWRIVFGKPVSFDGFHPADAEDEKLVARYTDTIRKTVQGMIDRELGRRRSVWV